MSTLYLVATPIGNLSDLSPRAREVLSTVDFIAAEDTRVTQKLLNACELPKKPMISYYEHNRRARGEAVLEKLLAGETCALVTDAGTPAVSDPGEDLVALCAEHDVPVIPIPGCCAAVCALAASGLPTGRWCFEGFLSVNKKARREHLDTLQGEKRTMIFYEAPHKLCATLRDLAALCDIFYIGGTKCGALFGEAVVFTKGNTPKHFLTQIKQHGALLAKGWLLGLQFGTLFTDDLYQTISKNAIETAAVLKKGLAEKGYSFFMDSPTNQVFIVLSNEQLAALEGKAKFGFWEKYDDTHTVVRIATSWATRMEEVEQLLELM